MEVSRPGEVGTVNRLLSRWGPSRFNGSLLLADRKPKPINRVRPHSHGEAQSGPWRGMRRNKCSAYWLRYEKQTVLLSPEPHSGSKIIRRLFAGIVVVLAFALLATQGVAADSAKRQHRLVIQINQNDEAVMNLALNNATNVIKYYHHKGEDAQIEVVAYGPGLNMLREDTSPVKNRIKTLKGVTFPKNLTFSACNNTKEGMEKREGHAFTIIPEASLVPSGAVRLVELQEQGWSYVRP